MAKDLFSQHATDYAKFRPGYPAALIEYIVSLIDKKDVAWDCATGNGQAAVLLSPHFKKIFATDLSEQQVLAATRLPNIEYSVASEHSTVFANDTFDLITAAQAYHWFDHQKFAAEAKRVGKPGAIVAIWAYALFRCSNEKVTRLVNDFYFNVTDPYWEPERKHIENNYADTPFYFEELPVKNSFKIEILWTIEQVGGYLNTWSAIKKFIKTNGYNPVDELMQDIKIIWGNEERLGFDFPLALRIGRV